MRATLSQCFMRRLRETFGQKVKQLDQFLLLMHHFYCLFVCYSWENEVNTLVWRNNHPLTKFHAFHRQNKLSCTKEWNQITSLTSGLAADCLYVLDQQNLLLYIKFCSPLQNLCCYDHTVLYLFPIINDSQKFGFHNFSVWYSIKSVYSKFRLILKIRSFGDSPETLQVSPKSSFSIWMPKRVSVPQKPIILGIFQCFRWVR